MVSFVHTRIVSSFSIQDCNAVQKSAKKLIQFQYGAQPLKFTFSFVSAKTLLRMKVAVPHLQQRMNVTPTSQQV